MAPHTRLAWTLIVATWCSCAAAPAGPVITDSRWRFTAVTDRLIRIEYDENEHFVDEPTIAFLRSKPLGVWEPAHTDGVWTVLNTSKVSLHYQSAGRPSEGTVIVYSRSDSSHVYKWGDDPEPGNLRGTARTLDSSAETLDLNCHNKVSPTMDNSQMHCTWGLISRKGWAVVNDTGAPQMQNDWYAPSRNTTDISVFMHGLDYTGALKDFFYAAGDPAVPPRYALGTIFTRWFDFDQDKVMSFVNDFESRSVPLDAFIFDMNWHIFGPWGSFTWNDDSYPRRQDMLDWFQKKGLHIGANTHDHDGISPKEATYNEVCKALGRTPGPTIPFDLYNKTYAMAQEDIAWRALESKDGKQGIDFAWIDYQQGESNFFQQTQIPNINPTIVMNALRSNDPKRHGEDKRSMVLSRWGGLGNHRYPVGFSGDQKHDWKGLQFLPYFTSTAANVAFNYWSHDTVGGNDALAPDYEFSVRWVQTSAWSPVLRFHDKGEGTGGCATTDACAKVVPWDVPSPFFEAIRKASQVRDQLMPYIYTAAFSTASTGLALVRPMYYENPSDDALYGLDHQYLFGPDMVVSPITQVSGPDALGRAEALGAVTWQLLAPKSAKWVDRINGDFFSGTNASDVYGINDVPSLVRQGAAIPMRPYIDGSMTARAVKPLNEIEFRITPAAEFYSGDVFTGSGIAIDDDGLSTGYTSGQFTKTVCEYSYRNGTFSIKVSQTGDFKDRPKSVTLRLSFTQLPPMAVTTPAMDVAYDHALLGTVFTMQNVDLTVPRSFEVSIQPQYTAPNLQNLIGVLGRVRRARYVKDALDVINAPYGDDRCNLTAYALTGLHMSPSFLQDLPQLWKNAVAQVAKVLSSKALTKDARRVKFVSAMMGLQSAGPAPQLLPESMMI